ncbi:MAG: rRNA pseudouridine synthase [Erysipelotrichaceae bacterium]|nr:rRNA pseudouridine synthase [Erysipelotrichaceae bacterium]
MRLDKLLAKSGYGSRKEVKKLIRSQRVKVNGILVKDDDLKIGEDDVVLVDEVHCPYQENYYIMLNKPKGYVSANEDDLHATVMDLIDIYNSDMFCVGRLDIDTTGLCLITTDGQLAHQLLSNKKHIEKEYLVDIEHPLSLQDIAMIEKGIIIDGGEQCLPAKVTIINESQISLVICEGKYHQVKRMLKAVGNQVVNLKRIRMKNLLLDETLTEGSYRLLTAEEIAKLKA